MIFASFFIFYSIVSQKMDHFDISFACSIFSKSWEVTNYGFLGAAHLRVTLRNRRFGAGGVFLIRAGFLGTINLVHGSVSKKGFP